MTNSQKLPVSQFSPIGDNLVVLFKLTSVLIFIGCTGFAIYLLSVMPDLPVSAKLELNSLSASDQAQMAARNVVILTSSAFTLGGTVFSMLLFFLACVGETLSDIRQLLIYRRHIAASQPDAKIAN